MVPCTQLPEAQDGRLSSLIEHHVETVQLYYACAERHQALTAAVRAMQGKRRPSAQTAEDSMAGSSWREQSE